MHIFRKPLAIVAAAVAAAMVLSGCSGSDMRRQSIPENTLGSGSISAIDSAVREAMEVSKSTEAVIGVWSSNGDYTATYSTQGTPEIDSSSAFRAAQTNQPIMCALLLDLVDEGLIELDREVTRDIPRLTGIGNVTYRQLCDGTSGIADFKPHLADENLLNPVRPWPPGELIAEGIAQQPLSWPGLDTHRSDTNAVILGRALSVFVQEDLDEVIEDRIFKPAGMGDTYIPVRPDDALVQTQNALDGTGYLPGPNCEAGPVDFSDVSVTMLGYAGNTVSTILDIKSFYENYLSGTYGGESGLATITTLLPTENPKRDEEGNPVEEAPEEGEEEAPAPSSFRGFGILKEGSLFGFDGAVPGSASSAWHDPETGFTVVVALNNATAGPALATALAHQIAAIVGQPGIPWTADEKAEAIAAMVVCPPEESNEESAEG